MRNFREDHWEKVIHRCEKDFKKSELLAIQKFIRENNHPIDVLALQITRKISIAIPENDPIFSKT